MFLSHFFRSNIKYLATTLVTLSSFVVLICNIQPANSKQDLLSPTERAWLVAHPDIRVAFSPDYAPLSFINKYGEQDGLVNDYFDIIQQRLNVKFNMVVPTLSQSAANKPGDKQADAVSLFAYSDNRNSYWLYTKPYFNLPLYIIGKSIENGAEDVTLKNLGNHRLVLVKHYAALDYVKQYYPNLSYELASNTCDGLHDAAFDAKDALISDLTAVSWCLRQQGWLNLRIIGKTEFNYTMGIAVRKDWPILQSIMDKGLASITPKEREEIYKRWNDTNLFEETWLQKNKIWVALGALFLLGLMLVRFYIWDRNVQGRILSQFYNYNFTNDDKQAPYALARSALHKLVKPSLVIFITALIFTLAFILYQHLYAHMWEYKSDHQALVIVVGILTLLSLASGYMLGGLRRGGEVEDLFCKLLQQFKLRQKSEKILSESEQRLMRQNAALKKLSLGYLGLNKQSKNDYKAFTELSAQTLAVGRVSIWLFLEGNNQQLQCVDMYELAGGQHSAGQIFRAEDFPIYFKALREQRVIAADNALSHPATVELAKEYLPNAGIGALLDATIRMNNEIFGAVCHEHIGAERKWTLDEQSFAGSIADALRISIESQRRFEAEQALKQHSEHLEDLVRARTAALENNASMNKFIIENAPATIITLDLDGNILEMNPAAQKVSGYSREYAIGKNYNDLFEQGGYIGDSQTLFEELKAGKRIRGEEFSFIRPDGSKIELSVSRSVEKDANGKDVVISVGQDISRQKAIEVALVEAREAAESADRIKTMFVASMSHELRTPLNSIIGFLGVVLQGLSGELNVKQKDQLSRAYSSSKHLLSLISDVIDISKIEAGFLQVRVEKFDLAPLLIEVQHATLHLAQEKKLSISIDCPANIKLQTDRKRVYQVLLNVLSNALKYSEQGGVKVFARVKAKQLEIKVQDTGIGISEADLAKLFKPFQRVESHLKIKTLGTGLGLYLSRKILDQLLSGKISVTSKLAEGSVFTITMPAKMPIATAQSYNSILEDAAP